MYYLNIFFQASNTSVSYAFFGLCGIQCKAIFFLLYFASFYIFQLMSFDIWRPEAKCGVEFRHSIRDNSSVQSWKRKCINRILMSYNRRDIY